MMKLFLDKCESLFISVIGMVCYHICFEAAVSQIDNAWHYYATSWLIIDDN